MPTAYRWRADRGDVYDRAMPARFSFEAVSAHDYDELRPGYAPEAVGWAADRGGLSSGSTIVDLAAGTGQLSRRFAALGMDTVAIEPAANMRATLASRLPSVRILDGTAEAIPLPDRVADAVVVGNAFHHFDRSRAFAEIRRVLRPDAVLAIFWAWPVEDRSMQEGALRTIDELVESTRARTDIATAYRSWTEPPSPARGFHPFQRREFPLTHVLPSARLADLYATSSDIASLPAAARDRLVGEIRDLARALPPTLHLPSRSVVDLCNRR
jgi:SAM-dependent methyltransferase